MKRVLIPMFCLSVSLACPTEFLRSQPPEQKPDGWLDLLRNDPRLKAKVSYQFPPRPAAEEVLGSVQRATGVPLSWAGQADKGKLIFGTTQASNVPAWKVMEVLALHQVTGGKWEKAGDGYVLHGEPKYFEFAAKPPGIINPKPVSDVKPSPAPKETFPPPQNPKSDPFPKGNTPTSQKALEVESPPRAGRELASWQVIALIFIGTVFAAAVTLIGLNVWRKRTT